MEQPRSVTITPPAPPPTSAQSQGESHTTLLPLSQQWHFNICKNKVSKSLCEYQRSKGGQEVRGALWINEGLCRNEIHVERKARRAGKRIFQAKALW